MKLSPRDRVLLGIIPVLALCAAFYVLVLTPQRRTTANLQKQIAAAQTQLTSAQQAWATGHAAQVALRKDSAEYAASKIAVPQVSNIPAMLRLLQRSADAVDVSVQTISLSSGSSSGASASTGSSSTGSAGAVTSVPVSLTLSGGYQAVERLVTRLNRYVIVTDHGLRVDGPLFGISSVSESPNSSNGTGVTVQLTTTIYQYASATTVEGSTSGATS